MKEYRICMPLSVEEVGELLLGSADRLFFLFLCACVLTKLSAMRLSFCTNRHVELLQPWCVQGATAGWSCRCLPVSLSPL